MIHFRFSKWRYNPIQLDSLKVWSYYYTSAKSFLYLSPPIRNTHTPIRALCSSKCKISPPITWLTFDFVFLIHSRSWISSELTKMEGLTKKLQIDIFTTLEIGVGVGNVLKTVLTQEDVSIFNIFFRYQYVTTCFQNFVLWVAISSFT